LKLKLSAYLNAINSSKKPMSDLDDDFDTVKKKYVPFVINRSLSYFPDCIMQANNMNMRYGLDKEMQFEYLRTSIRSKKRFSKWDKKDASEKVDMIMKYFGYNYHRASEVADLISDEDIESMKGQMDVGG
jgi:hypothetical protein